MITPFGPPVSVSPHHTRRQIASTWIHGLALWTHALTVTLRRHFRGSPTGRPAAAAAIKHFLKVLDALCYGSRRSRRRLRVHSAAVIGWGVYGVHPHAHLCLACPLGMTPRLFEAFVLIAIDKTQLFNEQFELKPYSNEGWVSYMLDHGDDALDYDALRIPATA